MPLSDVTCRPLKVTDGFSSLATSRWASFRVELPTYTKGSPSCMSNVQLRPLKPLFPYSSCTRKPDFDLYEENGDWEEQQK